MEFLISIIIILAGWTFLTRLIRIPFHFHKITETSIQSNTKQLKILSFNVRAFNLYNWTNNLNTEQEIIDFLGSQKADVICLQ